MPFLLIKQFYTKEEKKNESDVFKFDSIYTMNHSVYPRLCQMNPKNAQNSTISQNKANFKQTVYIFRIFFAQ